jgi:hypothetical protein
MLNFFIGLFVGANIGLVCAALLCAAGRADRLSENIKQNEGKT